MKKLVIEYRLWREEIRGGKFPLYKNTIIKVYRCLSGYRQLPGG